MIDIGDLIIFKSIFGSSMLILLKVSHDGYYFFFDPDDNRIHQHTHSQVMDWLSENYDDQVKTFLVKNLHVI